MIIYVTKNLVNGKKYIGKDSKNDNSYLGSGTLLNEDIKKYGKENFQKEIIEYCKSLEELGIREEYWINFFGACKSNEYYNLREGTSGWFNKDLTEEKRDYISNKIGKSNKGKKRTEETKEKIRNNEERKEKLRKANSKPKPEGFGQIISEIKKSQNIKYSEEHKRKITEGKLGKPHPKKGKFILQFDKDGNFIREWNSIKEVVLINKNWKQANISCCLIKKSKLAYGFIWKYK